MLVGCVVLAWVLFWGFKGTRRRHGLPTRGEGVFFGVGIPLLVDTGKHERKTTILGGPVNTICMDVFPWFISSLWSQKVNLLIPDH